MIKISTLPLLSGLTRYRFLTVRKAAGKIRLIQKALDMPTMASGLVRLIHDRKDLIPIPGSITTGMAPTRKRANAQLIRFGPGLTKSRAFVPRPIPARVSSSAAQLTD